MIVDTRGLFARRGGDPGGGGGGLFFDLLAAGDGINIGLGSSRRIDGFFGIFTCVVVFIFFFLVSGVLDLTSPLSSRRFFRDNMGWKLK